MRDYGIDEQAIRHSDSLTPWDKAAELEAMARARDDDNFWRETSLALMQASRPYQTALDLYNTLSGQFPSLDQRCEQLRLHLIAKGLLSADDARRIPAQPPITAEQRKAMVEAERERARLQDEIDQTLQSLSLQDRQTAMGIYNQMRQERSIDKIKEWRGLLRQRGIHATKVMRPEVTK